MTLLTVAKQRTTIIRVLSFLAFTYAVFGFININYFHWFDTFWLSGYSEKIAIVSFGIWRLSQEKNAYTRKRIAVLTFLILTIWLLFPYFTGSNFLNHHVIGSFWFYIYLVIILLFGRRADCSWNCPCVGIRDTAGDAFRNKTLKGDWAWKLRHLKWPFLASLLIYLALLLLFPQSFSAWKYFYYFSVINIGLYFASLLVIPWTGNRNYCRYLCPWGSLYGVIGKLGFFKIIADQENCLECGKCERNCDMGIPLQSLVREHGVINVPDCVGCGRCVTECPTGALRIVDVRDTFKLLLPKKIRWSI